MKRIALFCLILSLSLGLSAQNTRKRTTQKRQTTTKTQKKSTATQKKKSTAQPQKKQSKQQLQKEQADIQKKRKASQQQAQHLNKDIKATLDSVLILDNHISRQQQSIDSLNTDIRSLQVRIDTLTNQLDQLQRDLTQRKQKFAKAMVHMQRNRHIQQRLMFIFSAKNLEQMLRRVRYLREYSAYQRAQGQIIKQKQEEVKRKQDDLLAARSQLETHRQSVQQKQRALQHNKSACQQQVDFLNKNLATVQQQIKQYQAKEAELNAQIDRIIQEEIAEAKRKAEEERRRKEVEKRRKAEAERQRLAAAKAAREKAEAEKRRAEAAAKAAASEEEKKTAKAEVKRAESTLKSAKSEEKEAEKALAKAEKKEAKTTTGVNWNTEDASERRLSSSFASNKGRLPMPITGSYSVVGHYGRYTVPGLSRVTLDNKGIDIRGQAGAQARAVFNGTVSRVFQYGGQYIVMLRHGTYISVYSGLSSVSVKQGQKVTTRQALGAVGTNADGQHVLHFQLRQESSRLNPEQWVR